MKCKDFNTKSNHYQRCGRSHGEHPQCCRYLLYKHIRCMCNVSYPNPYQRCGRSQGECSQRCKYFSYKSIQCAVFHIQIPTNIVGAHRVSAHSAGDCKIVGGRPAKLMKYACAYNGKCHIKNVLKLNILPFWKMSAELWRLFVFNAVFNSSVPFTFSEIIRRWI